MLLLAGIREGSSAVVDYTHEFTNVEVTRHMLGSCCVVNGRVLVELLRTLRDLLGGSRG